MTTLFISDLHLQASAPEIGAQLRTFLGGDAAGAETLYILGDLFEAWIGDDDPDPYHAGIQELLGNYARAGTRCYFMHGNRDFLVGSAFAERTGFTLLNDPVVHTINATDVLLSHGDRYCTDDHEYQAVRANVRDPAWQAQVLSLPIDIRRQMAGNARAESSEVNQHKSMEIMDVNADAIIAALDEHGVTNMLHGHTHRPAIHEFALPNGTAARRMVLGDWYTQGSVGVWDERGFSLEVLPR